MCNKLFKRRICQLETSGNCVVPALPWCASILIRGNPTSATMAQKKVSKRKTIYIKLKTSVSTDTPPGNPSVGSRQKDPKVAVETKQIYN